MNAQDMLENALLDACGLLETDEQAAFEEAFARAPESVKAQIRREQSRFADLTELLPNVKPRPELRRLVIDAVRDAAKREHTDLTLALTAADSAPRIRPGDIRRRKTVRYWRVATIVLAASTVFVSAVTLELKDQINQLGDQLSTNTSADFFLRFGEMPGLRQAMLNPSSQRITFSPVDASSGATAALFLDPDQGIGYLVTNRLPKLKSGTYEVVAVGEHNEILRSISAFKSNGETDGHEFKLTPDIGGSLAIAMRNDTGELELVMIVA